MTDIVERDKAGKWLKPPKGGRRPGPSRAEVISDYIEPHAKEILDKMISLAKLGDGKSAQLVLERLAPIAKQDSERTIVPGFSAAGTLEQKASAVLEAIAGGAISAEAGERLLRCLDIYGRAVKQDEIEARLAAVEAGHVLVKPADVIDNEPGA